MEQNNYVTIDGCEHGAVVYDGIKRYTFSVILLNAKKISITHYCRDKRTAIIKTIEQVKNEFNPPRIRLCNTKLWSGLKNSTARIVDTTDKHSIVEITYICKDEYDNFTMQYKIGLGSCPDYFMNKFLGYANIRGEFYRYIVETDAYTDLCTYCAGGTVINAEGL